MHTAVNANTMVYPTTNKHIYNENSNLQVHIPDEVSPRIYRAGVKVFIRIAIKSPVKKTQNLFGFRT